jgi:hypothetical protein
LSHFPVTSGSYCFLQCLYTLQAAALLALTQLMAVDGAFCSDNVAVLFTLLHKRCALMGLVGCVWGGGSKPG